MTKREAERHAKQSVIYAVNAGKAFSEKEYEKAGEFVWGAMSQAIKAHALAKNDSKFRGHSLVRKYAQKLSVEWENSKKMTQPTFYDIFHKAEGLHSNFYEINEDPAVIEDIMRQTKPVIFDVLKDAGFEPAI